MNLLLISDCDFSDNSAIHVYSVAKELSSLGIHCAVSQPGHPPSTALVGELRFPVIPYSVVYSNGVVFPDGRGPDLIHAWTPRELVRKITERLVSVYGCKYVVHLSDNEEFILENELTGLTYDELCQLPVAQIDAFVPEDRSHPIRYPTFLSGAAGVTALIDRLLEFKPPDLPGIVFWPGFDVEFLNPPGSVSAMRSRFRIPDGTTVLVYNGNVHQTNAGEIHSLFLAVEVLRRVGRRVALLWAGRRQIQESWIQRAIDSGGVIDLGFLPRMEMHSLLTVADILVQPGKSDRFNDYRFPSKLPEFFASGKPVILPRANVGRFLQDGIDALLLNDGNAVEIAETIEVLVDSPDLAARIGAAGREFAIRRLTWGKNVAPVRGFYDDILAVRSQTLSHRKLNNLVLIIKGDLGT